MFQFSVSSWMFKDTVNSVFFCFNFQVFPFSANIFSFGGTKRNNLRARTAVSAFG